MKLNFIKIMETMNISIDNKINLGIINNKEFIRWFKQEIKALVEDQRIAKRDRKDEKHPCPENRKYSIFSARDRVQTNKDTLRTWYAIYYTLRHNREFDWSTFEIEKGLHIWNPNIWSMKTEDCKTFDAFIKDATKRIDPGFDPYGIEHTIASLVEKYVKDVKEKEALYPCR